MNRRHFVSSLAVAGLAAASGPRMWAANGGGARPRLGVIGCGWYAGVNMESFFRHTDVVVVSLCDVNTQALTRTLAAVAKHQKEVPRTFGDFREMLKLRDLDIVIVGTPDHWHAVPAIAAMQAGADLFLEKPVGVDVMEGEALVAAARKYDRVVQVNTQRRSMPLFGEAREKYIRSGRLGKIADVETFCYMGMGRGAEVEAAPVPDYLDYEMWTGPAPRRPFNARLESRGWRRYQEYGNGIVGDMGVHMFDIARWMLGLGWPTKISSTGGILVEKASDATTTDTQTCVFEYPDLRVSWEHRTWGVSPIPVRHWTDQWGVRFLGDKGRLSMTTMGYVFEPTGGGETEGFHLLAPDGNPANMDVKASVELALAPAEQRHAEDFMAARKTRGRPVADIEEAHISSSSCVLANIAQELGRPVSYDPVTRTVPGDAEATALLARHYRGPWVHPTVETV